MFRDRAVTPLVVDQIAGWTSTPSGNGGLRATRGDPTLASVWQAMVGGSISDELLEWPPDVSHSPTDTSCQVRSPATSMYPAMPITLDALHSAPMSISRPSWASGTNGAAVWAAALRSARRRLVDALTLHLAPLVLGAGTPPIHRRGAAHAGAAGMISTSTATHLTYNVL